MENKLTEIFDLENELIEQVKSVVNKTGLVKLEHFPFYVSCVLDAYEVEPVHVTELFIAGGELCMRGDTPCRECVEISICDDIVGFVGFDMYNSVCQEMEFE